ncbi:MAG: septation protein SpoVG family protein [Phycisphaerales bacterium]|nr:septation protein SpoVG family protein [Phycisphaerales bacterium]
MVGEDSERLRAFCSVTIDDAFVIRDLKVIDGDEGPFVAMPSRKMSDHCVKCGEKNHLRAKFCNECGARLNPNRAPRDAEGRVKLYADVAHPINVESREMIQEAVIEAFNEELTLSQEPGYFDETENFDDHDEDFAGFDDLIAELRKPKTDRDTAPSQQSDRREDERKSPRQKSRDSRQAAATEAPADRKPPRDKTSGHRSPADTADPARRERRSTPVDTSPSGSDDDDFAAGLDWTPAPAKTSARAESSTRAGANGRDHRDGRERQTDVDSGPDAERPATDSGRSQQAAGGADSDDFGAGIL